MDQFFLQECREPCFLLDEALHICKANAAGEALHCSEQTFAALLRPEEYARLREGLSVPLYWSRSPRIYQGWITPSGSARYLILHESAQTDSSYVRVLQNQLQDLQSLLASIPVIRLSVEDDSDGAPLLESAARRCYSLLRSTVSRLWCIRLSEGPIPLLDAVDVTRLLQVLCTAVNEFTGQPIITFSKNADRPLPVRTDLQLLEQIFLHLLQNGVLYAADVPDITVTVTCDDTHALVRITDRGKGMQPQVLAHAFEANMSCDPYCDTDRPTGDGLGLFLVRQGLRAMGGECVLESAFGSGTQLSVMLPLADEGLPLIKSRVADYLVDPYSCIYQHFIPLNYWPDIPQA